MTWAALIEVLLTFFGPILKQLLDDLFKRAAPKLATAVPVSDELKVRDVFAAARAETSWWQIRKRAILAACERVAADRADELVAAAKGAPAVVALTESEAKAIASAM